MKEEPTVHILQHFPKLELSILTVEIVKVTLRIDENVYVNMVKKVIMCFV